MVFEEGLDKLEESSVELLVSLERSDIDGSHALEDELGELGEGVVVVVLTDREVYEVARYAVYVDLHLDSNVFVEFLVDVSGDSLGGHAFKSLQVLADNFGDLLEDNESVNVPGVESESVAPIVHHLAQEVEDQQHHFVVVDESVQSPRDADEVVREKPVEEQTEVFARRHACHDALEDVEQLHDLLSA
jgi:hypothetical protein